MIGAWPTGWDFSMWGAVHVPTYVVGAVLIVLLPGPNSLYVLATAAKQGIRAGYWAAAGVFLGDTVLMMAASAGVASLLKAYPALFASFKFIGAIYLAYLGCKMLWGAIKSTAVAPASRDAVPASPPPMISSESSPLRRAFGISLLNPKAILFFVAFFVQFVDPAYAYPALSFLVLGVILQVLSVAYLSALIFSGARLADAFRRRARLARALNAGAGSVFLGFSAKLATATVG